MAEPIDGMKCACGKVMEVAEAMSYGSRCEECWLTGQCVDVRGSFVAGDKRTGGNVGNSPSPKVWPKVLRGRRSVPDA